MDRTRGLCVGFLSAALFGVATPLSKHLLAGIPPTVLAGLLYLGAAAALLPAVLGRGGGTSIPRDRANRLRLCGAVLFGGVVGPVLLLSGLELSRAASVSMLLSLETVATAVFALVLFREHIGRWAWFAVFGIVLAGSLLGAEGGAAVPGPSRASARARAPRTRALAPARRRPSRARAPWLASLPPPLPSASPRAAGPLPSALA